MLKQKKFLSLLLFLPVFSLFACTKVKEDYKVVTDQAKVKDHLVVEGTLKEKTYETKDAHPLNLDGLTVTIDGNPQDLTHKRITSKKDVLESGFFVCSNKDFPTNSIIGLNDKPSTNVEKSDFTFYIATTLKDKNDSYTVYVYESDELKVTITNANAIKPWVWYVVTAVVIFGIVAMVTFTRRYKAKKEGKI
ncbi:MAG: hypothetical protein MJ207_01245 [Bacilli bacterium]|nr:hypothetical protein [Bacilli bacterium]